MNATDRQYAVDRLRGFAVFAVLVVNTPFLMTSVVGATAESMPTGWDLTAGYITWALFQAKSYVIFSFLFGYSLVIFLERAAAKGVNGRRAYRQRLFALALFGAVHAVLLFVGDILVLYALLGSTLLLLRKRSDRFLLRLAAVLFACQIALLGAVLAATAIAPVAGAATLTSDAVAIDRSWGEDGFLAATVTRLQVWPFAFVLILVVQGLIVMALFCVGIVAGRRRWLADPNTYRHALQRVRRWGLLVGMPPSFIGAALVVFTPDAAGGLGFMGGLVLIYLTAPVASAGYIATIALLPRRGVARVLETDGTMSLTLYLGESLVMTTLAAGWGFGLFGLNTGPALLVAVAAWAALSAGAWVWHRRFPTGPAEIVLRRLTYAGLGTPPAAGDRPHSSEPLSKRSARP